MKLSFAPLVAVAALLWAAPTGLLAQGPEPAAADPPELTVAVLDFVAESPDNANLGREIADALGALLDGREDFRLVDRQSLARTLEEQELNLTGLVDTTQAVKVGRLVGAKIMLSGRWFTLGRQTFLTAKLIGTETSLVRTVLVKKQGRADVGDMAFELAEKVAALIAEDGGKLVAGPAEEGDPLPALREQLSKKQLPVMAVLVVERHHASPRPAQQPIDPAVETEIKTLLIQAGLTLRDIPENDLTDFAREWSAQNVHSWPRGLNGVDLLIAGKAFSEYAARMGNLVSCSARAEINVIRRRDGRIIIADRTTTRNADLSENIAGKNALQAAGRELGFAILEHLAETLPDKPKPEDVVEPGAEEAAATVEGAEDE